MTEEQARQRFMMLNLVRLTGVILSFIGIANIGGKLAPTLTPVLGIFLLVTGVVDFFLLPVLLKKAWQKQDQ